MEATTPHIEALMKYDYFCHRMTAEAVNAQQERVTGVRAQIIAAQILSTIIARHAADPDMVRPIEYVAQNDSIEAAAAEARLQLTAHAELRRQQGLLENTVTYGAAMMNIYREEILENAYNEEATRRLATGPVLYLVENCPVE